MADITEINFKPKSFEATILISVLEHLEKQAGWQMLEEIERWAKKKIIISTLNGFLTQKNIDDNSYQIHPSGWTIKDMRLLFIYYRYPLYFQGSYFQEFLNRLSRSVDQVYLLTAHHPKGKFKKPRNLKIFWLPYLGLSFIGEFFFILGAFLKAVFVKDLIK